MTRAVGGCCLRAAERGSPSLPAPEAAAERWGAVGAELTRAHLSPNKGKHATSRGDGGCPEAPSSIVTLVSMLSRRCRESREHRGQPCPVPAVALSPAVIAAA